VGEWKYRSARDLDLKSSDALKSVRREVGLATRITTTLRWLLVRVYLKWVHRLEVGGLEHLPKELPFVMVANHASHLDALMLASILPPRINCSVFPIAAGDTFFETKPTAAFASLFMNALPIWRRNCGAHSLEILRERLTEEPCGYVIFPEGTRSRTGEMGRFKPGIGKLVAGSSVAVIPCRIEGAHEAFPPAKLLPRPRKLRLIVGEALCFEGLPNQRDSWNEVARQLQHAVEFLADTNRRSTTRPSNAT
jgi:1-acyl-sn-glycerol-3-phosphate acyltransferase